MRRTTRRKTLQLSRPPPAPTNAPAPDGVFPTAAADGADGAATIARLPGMLPDIFVMGRSVYDPIWREKEHAGQHTELMHVLRGQAKVVTRQYAIVAQEGDTVYMPQRMLHRDVFPVDSIFEVYLVHFNWPGEAQMLQAFSPVQLAKVSQPARRNIAMDFHRLEQDLIANLPHSRELSNARLLQIIYTLCQEAAVAARDQGSEQRRRQQDQARARRIQLMTLARQIIQRNFATALSLETIAAALDISPYYLSHIFSEETGFTLSRYVTDVRMEQALKLLHDPRLNIGDVAHATGFRDSHYFGKVFKSRFKMSPKAYRASLTASVSPS